MSDIGTVTNLKDKIRSVNDHVDHYIQDLAGFILGAKEVDGVTEFMRQREITIGGDGVSTPDGFKRRPGIKVMARDWLFHSEYQGTMTGGWIEMEHLHLDGHVVDQEYFDLATALLGHVGRHLTVEIPQVRDTDPLLVASHTFEEQGNLGVLPNSIAADEVPNKKPVRIQASVEIPFDYQFDFRDWRMFDWLQHKSKKPYMLSVLMQSEWADRLPFPVIRDTRKFFFESEDDAAFFRLKWG